MPSTVNVIYEDYSTNNKKPISIDMRIFDNIEVLIEKTEKDGQIGVSLSMKNYVFEDTELAGWLDKETLCSYIKALKEIYSQL